MIKRLFAASALAAMLAGCGTTVPTATVNDKAAIAIRSVTAARQTSTALLQAKKISKDADIATQAKLDVVRAGIESARLVADPTAQAAKLDEQKAAADKINTDMGGTTP